MSRCLFAGILMILLAFLLHGFWADAAYARTGVVYKKARPKKELPKEKKEGAKEKQEAQEDEKKDQGKEDTKTGEDVYDPFDSYLVKRERVLRDLEKERRRKLTALEKLKSLKEARTALQKLDLSQLKITAIVKGKDRSWAMVKDSKGMGYVLKKGTYIGTNGGVVDQIVRETKKTQFGRVVTRKVIIKEPYLTKEGKIDYKLVEMKMPSTSYD